jgi:hypothetical protein
MQVIGRLIRFHNHSSFLSLSTANGTSGVSRNEKNNNNKPVVKTKKWKI